MSSRKSLSRQAAAPNIITLRLTTKQLRTTSSIKRAPLPIPTPPKLANWSTWSMRLSAGIICKGTPQAGLKLSISNERGIILGAGVVIMRSRNPCRLARSLSSVSGRISNRSETHQITAVAVLATRVLVLI